MSKEEVRGLVYVALAVTFFSTSPVLIRWAAPVSPFEITFWRLTSAAPIVLLLATLAGERIDFRGQDLPRFVLFGLIAALHFFFYISSLSFTSISHSLALVYTSPVFVTLFSGVFLKEPILRRKYAGIALALVGVAVLAGFEPKLSWRMLLGDALAVGSAVCFGLYSVVGRGQRANYPLLTYALGVYGMAALWMAPLAAASFRPAYHPGAVLAILALGVFPLGFGHTLYNAALRRLHATYVNLIATQEVTGGILLGYFLLGEAPSFNSLLGAAVTLAGIAVVLL
ncbi:MAG: DMT family transporter [Chloroflexi bacterium]|nr:DMT family transporter [Chloroflexota bacterium]